MANYHSTKKESKERSVLFYFEQAKCSWGFFSGSWNLKAIHMDYNLCASPDLDTFITTQSSFSEL